MTPWLLMVALSAPVAQEAPAPTSAVAPTAVAAPDAPPAPSAETFLQSVAIACPADATRTTFPLVPNTLFDLESMDAVSSGTSQKGDRFDLRLREPLRYGPVVLVAAGTPVHGEVTHATENRWGGIGGELILAARYVQLPQGRLRLRASIAAPGAGRTNTAATITVLFGIAGVFVQGDNKMLPAGTALTARLAEPVTFHCEGTTAPPPGGDTAAGPLSHTVAVSNTSL
ncbi:hypothetical protein ACFPOA_02710 [Lysobacter niabensis]|uniref:hypothetical protein n=1 Tax=Agrilutibacter niabensis TaxID=380628 RepID=UPI00360FFE67